MSKKSRNSKILSWIFFVVGVGSLIAAGIYLEKVMILGPSLWDSLRAISFGLLGIGMLGVLTFEWCFNNSAPR
jgi:hypothetical protein